MRNRNLNPKSKKITAEQEAALECHEGQLVRAEIISRGVAEYLKNGDTFRLDIAAEMLREAASTRESAWKGRQAAGL